MSHINLSRGIAAVLFLTTPPIAGASHTSLITIKESPTIYIRLVDLAGLPNRVRLEAEATVQSIFHRAGVHLEFIECADAVLTCRTAPKRTDWWLQILNHPPDHLGGDSTGFAVLVPADGPGDSYAAVSFPMVEAAARGLDAPVSQVLAASLAHEIGHLLLHSPKHSANGIMKPRLDRSQIDLMDRGELLFTREEAARLMQRIGSH